MTTTANGNTKTFVSSKGIELVLRPVSQFKLDSLRASAEEIPVPQYEMTIVGGEKILHPMDATIAQNQNRMDEWNEYLKAKSANERDKAKRFTDLLLFDGVELDVPVKTQTGREPPKPLVSRSQQTTSRGSCITSTRGAGRPGTLRAWSRRSWKFRKWTRRWCGRSDSFRAKAKRHADQPVRPKNGKMASSSQTFGDLEVAHFWGRLPSEFWAASLEDRIYMTAYFQTHHEIKAIEDHEIEKQIERNKRKTGRR
jgi:hypothetical protein